MVLGKICTGICTDTKYWAKIAQMGKNQLRHKVHSAGPGYLYGCLHIWCVRQNLYSDVVLGKFNIQISTIMGKDTHKWVMDRTKNSVTFQTYEEMGTVCNDSKVQGKISRIM